jgi:hypothetical protein
MSDEWEEFARLLLGDKDFDAHKDPAHKDPAHKGPDDVYAGLDDADQFALAVHFAQGGRLGVPDDYEPGELTRDDENTPRAPRPDRSQGRHAPPAPDPANLFAARVLDRLNYPPARWRDL